MAQGAAGNYKWYLWDYSGGRSESQSCAPDTSSVYTRNHGYTPRRSGKSYGLSRTPWSAHCGVWPDGWVWEAVPASDEGKAADSQRRERSWLRNEASRSRPILAWL